MEYREFFHIEIKHPYFSGMPEDLILEVESETKKRLNTLSFLIKKTVTGIRILAPVHKEYNDISSLEEEDIFRFYIYPTSEYIYEITDIEKGYMIPFTNKELKTNSFDLKASQTIRREMFHGFPTLARIEIAGKKVADSLGENPPKFLATFKAKSVKWKYYFVTNPEDTIKLESRDEQISFNELVIEKNTLDQITTSLQLTFPNAQITVFESNDEIAYTQKPRKNIKLFKGDNQLIAHLPNPKIINQGVQVLNIMTINEIQ